jgi:hypothetical protein
MIAGMKHRTDTALAGVSGVVRFTIDGIRRENQVRTGLSAGGSRIRTIGPV